MEEFSVSVSQEGRAFDYRVVDKQTGICEYEVFLGEILMAVFEPDENEYIHICRNPGALDEEVIVQIADGIGAHFL